MHGTVKIAGIDVTRKRVFVVLITGRSGFGCRLRFPLFPTGIV
jgi:hypothetical protein